MGVYVEICYWWCLDINRDLEQENKNNRKRLWGCLIGLAILFFVPIIFFFWVFSYVTNYKEFDLVVSHSPNNINTIKVVEVGESFYSSIRLKYKNNHFDTSINNDGRTIDLSNVEVNWINNEEAIIILDGEEQLPEIIKFEVKDKNTSLFKVEHVELGYIPTHSQQDRFGDYEIQIRKFTYSKGSKKQYNFDAPVRVYYGLKDSELRQYKEWHINEFSDSDSFELYWNGSYVLINVFGENNNGTTYVKDTLEILFDE